MSSTDSLSPLLGLLLMGDGLHDSDWGDQTNSNLLIIEQAIAGVSTITGLAGGTTALTASQVIPKIIILQGTLTSNLALTVPVTAKSWVFVNQTTGGFTTTIQTVGGTNIIPIDANASIELYSDGVNINALEVDVTPVGVAVPYYGVELPSAKFDWANGAPVSRAGFAPLFNAITRATTATANSGTVSLACPEDLTAKGLIGGIIEGAGIPSNTLVTAITSTTITISNATTGALSGTAVRIFPFGNGNGSTTFNKPDGAQRAIIGRGNMGGVGDPGRITTATIAGGAVNLGSTAGSELVTLTTAQMPAHNHPLSDPGHAHPYSDPNHLHAFPKAFSVGVGSGGGGGFSSYIADNTAVASTNITINGATTGITISSTGGGGSHSNMQAFGLCNFIVRII